MDIIFCEFWGIFAVAQQIINGNNQLHWSFSLMQLQITVVVDLILYF